MIYPPISVQRLASSIKKQDYYLVVSRIVGSKGLELLYDLGNKYKIVVAGRAINNSGEEIVQNSKTLI